MLKFRSILGKTDVYARGLTRYRADTSVNRREITASMVSLEKLTRSLPLAFFCALLPTFSLVLSKLLTHRSRLFKPTESSALIPSLADSRPFRPSLATLSIFREIIWSRLALCRHYPRNTRKENSGRFVRWVPLVLRYSRFRFVLQGMNSSGLR